PAVISRSRIFDLGIIGSAKRAAHLLPPRSGYATSFVSFVPWFAIYRKPGTELPGTLAHARLDCAVIRCFGRQRAQHLNDPVSDGPKLAGSETGGRCRGCAEANPRGNRRLLRVERNPVFVAGDSGSPETRLRVPPGQPQRPQIDEHQMRVGSARDDLKPG